MTPEIYDWEATLHKMVTSKAGDLVGNVDAVEDTSILVFTEGALTHYKIPKHMIEGYDGQSHLEAKVCTQTAKILVQV
jgi:hypothetical protein